MSQTWRILHLTIGSLLERRAPGLLIVGSQLLAHLGLDHLGGSESPYWLEHRIDAAIPEICSPRPRSMVLRWSLHLNSLFVKESRIVSISRDPRGKFEYLAWYRASTPRGRRQSGRPILLALMFLVTYSTLKAHQYCSLTVTPTLMDATFSGTK
ncbi:uncharacterized protein FFB14_15276 [Fusarium fujikuroi]|nr:uncharacterized protein FFB14_15276 [Fusarium fujikuroi]